MGISDGNQIQEVLLLMSKSSRSRPRQWFTGVGVLEPHPLSRILALGGHRADSNVTSQKGQLQSEDGLGQVRRMLRANKTLICGP